MKPLSFNTILSEHMEENYDGQTFYMIIEVGCYYELEYSHSLDDNHEKNDVSTTLI